MIWYVIDEGVLRHVIGDQTVMGAQLDRVIEAAGTPGIVIQVLPFTADHAGTDGPISHLSVRGSPGRHGQGGNCVAVAGHDGRVLVRDTQDRQGPALKVTPAAWRELVAQVKGR